MVFGTLTDSSQKGDAKAESHLVKMQKVFRLGLFAMNPVRQADKDPIRVQPTNLDLNTSACEVLSVIDIRRHSVDSVISTNLSFIDPWETHALSSRVEHWDSQNTRNVYTNKANTRPPSPVKANRERRPENSAIARTTSYEHSLQSAHSPSKANSRLITESITAEPHSMSTSSRKSGRTAKRQCSRSRLPKSSLPPESGSVSGASKRSKSCNRRAAPVEPPPLFPMDSFLPRAKPPPPLKIPTKHQRNRSIASVAASPPSPISAARPQTPYQSRNPLEPASFFPVPDMTLPIPPLPALPHPPWKKSSARTPRSQRSNPQLASSQGSMQASNTPVLTRADTGLSATSAESATSESAVTPPQFAPAWTWAPPPSWAGPPPEGDEVTGGVPRGTSKLVRKRSAKGRPNGCQYSNPRLNLSSTSLWRSRSPDPAEVDTPAQPSVRKAGQKPPEVVVKEKGIHGKEWHERAMAEVIPKLRALKTSG
ncbi:hypothetical protein PAXRUDRAFT_550759 [Paxillus rubicundulus Ve08.2h10]|uniref:Uncharacterized protein n=1 Tax=Paxillus rubicundulus Ve08.2h10 TaxID=930991 RepID=A0A0D0DZX8_9AGAM|nr:hypothetical protein PAXRUDRAFT_550759 [Paxillus rubicundulus Ve08.2h10]